MRLNKYLFNRVNNKERERGQRSVVWLKRGQPCLHHLHVLSTVFSWRPFSSFSLWIILLQNHFFGKVAGMIDCQKNFVLYNRTIHSFDQEKK